MKFDEGVVLVEHGGVPGFGDEAHEALFGGGGVGARDEAESLGYAEVVAVDAECAAAEGGEVGNCAAGLGADTGELLEPRTDLFSAIFCEEVEGEGAVAFRDALQGLLELRGFDFGEGDDGDGSFDLCDLGVADGIPVAGAGVEGALEVAHDLMRGWGFGASA